MHDYIVYVSGEKFHLCLYTLLAQLSAQLDIVFYLDLLDYITPTEIVQIGQLKMEWKLV